MCIKLNSSPVIGNLELKKNVNTTNFNNKLETIVEKGQISKSQFQDLAKKITGGQESLGNFLKSNNIVPAKDVDKLTSFHIGFNSRLKVNIQNSGAIQNLMSRVQPERDGMLLKQTKDDAKPVDVSKNFNQLPNAMQKDVSTLVSSLSKASSGKKEEVLSKASDFGKSFVENLPAKVSNEFIVKSPEQIKNSVAEAVVNSTKDKSRYQDAVSAYKSSSSLTYKVNELISTYNTMADTKSEKAVAIKNKIISTLESSSSPHLAEEFKTTDKSMYKKFGMPKAPDPMSYLSEDNKNLVNKISEGMSSVNPPNKVKDVFKLDDLPKDDKEKLNKCLKDAAGSKTTPSVDIPKSIELNGKTYDFKKVLAGGGDGIALLMEDAKSKEKVIVKSPIVDLSNKDDTKTAIDGLKTEIVSHIQAMGDGHNNSIGLKGVVKMGDTLLPVTELAKGGEMNDVTDKINDLGSKNQISSENVNLLKTFMIKDALQGLQDLHTEKNMAHYDIKPKNFFVGENGKVMLADFGRAKVEKQSPDGEGTSSYLPPETGKINGGGGFQFSEKTDVFAMGLTISETFKGRNPFVEKDGKFSDKEPLLEAKEPMDHVINAMTSFSPENRPNITSVLKHSVFNTPEINNPAVKDKAGELLNAIIDNKVEDIVRINAELTQLLKK